MSPFLMIVYSILTNPIH